jgi:hypothetical protein
LIFEACRKILNQVNISQGGLLDIALHPNFKKNQFIYFSYSAVKKEDGATLGTTAIMRARLNGDKLEDQKVIFEALPYSKTRHHYGSRLAFGMDGLLYFSVGERGNEKVNPQSIANDLGKIHRITDDGKVPADNPFVNTPGAKPTIYAYGNRNPQGLLFNTATGQLLEHELCQVPLWRRDCGRRAIAERDAHAVRDAGHGRLHRCRRRDAGDESIAAQDAVDARQARRRLLPAWLSRPRLVDTQEIPAWRVRAQRNRLPMDQ